MKNIERKLIKTRNGRRIFSYIPKVFFKKIGFDKEKEYDVKYWTFGKSGILSMKLIERKKGK
jgi:hypothetical protein